MKSTTFASCVNQRSNQRIGRKGANALYRSAIRPRLFERFLRLVRLCVGSFSPRLDQVLDGVLDDANDSFQVSLGNIEQSGALGVIRAEVREGFFPARLVIHLCRQDLKRAGLSIPTKDIKLLPFLQQEDVALIIDRVLPGKTWGDVLVALQDIVERQYVKWIGKCKDVRVICGWGDDGESSLRDVFDVVGFWDPNRPAVVEVERYRIVVFRDTANSASLHLVSRGLAKDLLFAVGIERLTDYIYDFLEEYFTTDQLTGPEVIEKYFGFLSNSARSRLVGHPYLSGKRGWRHLGLIWRMMVDIVRSHPVFSDFFGSDLDPLLKYFGLLEAA